MQRKPISKVLSLFMAICLVLGMVPMTVFAEGGTPLGDSGDPATPTNIVVVTAFDALSDDELWQGYDLGEIKSQENLNLPDALIGTDEDENPITIEGVTWRSNPAFDPETPDTYTFNPVLPEGYAPAEGAAAPVISVVIRLEGAGAGTLTAGATGSMTIGGTNVADLTQNANGTGWSWVADTATLTLGGGYTGEAIKINCQDGDTIKLDYIDGAAVTGSNSSASALYCNGSLNISGSGTFTVNYTGGGDYCALEVMGALTVNSGTLNAESNGTKQVAEAVTIYGGKGVTISGSANVTATATGANANGIQCNSGRQLNISTSGTVTANGTGTGYAIFPGGMLGTTNLSNGNLRLSSGTPGNALAGTVNRIGGSVYMDNTQVYRATLTLSGVSEEMVITGISDPATVYGIEITGTGADGKAYFWLPGGNQTVTLKAIDKAAYQQGGTTTDTYTGTVNVTTDHQAAGTLAKSGGTGGTATGSMTIGGTSVADLTQNANGTGWSWVADTATLTLDGNYPNEGIVIECDTNDTINLILTGNVSIQKTGYNGSDRSLWVDGSLNIKAGAYTLNVSSDWPGIKVEKNLVIESGTIKTTGNNWTNGIEVSGDITISGSANVEATGNVNGLQANGDILIDTTGTVTANGGMGGMFSEGEITVAGATVTVNGGSYSGMTAANGITVTSGNVTTNSTGIANGDVKCNLTVNGAGANVTINGSIVKGTGPDDFGADLTVSGGNVTVTGTVAGTRNLTGGTVSVGGVQVYPAPGPASPETITYPGTSLQNDPFDSSYKTLMPVSSTSNNSVTVNSGGAVITGAVYGGFDKNGSTDVTGNTVTINGGEISGNSLSAAISGGRAQSGAASGNTVTINGGTITGSKFLRGGESMTGNAKDNHIIITGGTIEAQIEAGIGSGTVENNSISIREGGALDLSGSHLKGGDTAGSALNIERAAVTVKQISGFKQCNFKLPATTTNGGVILTATTGANINGAAIGITFAGAPSFNLNDKITLIDNASGTLANDTVTASGYTFGIAVDSSGKLIATVTAVPGGGGVTTYSITVTKGTANPTSAAQGQAVTITANPAPSGQQFKEWSISSNVTTLTDGTSKTDSIAKFIMPAGNVTATAVYEKIPATVTSVTVTPSLVSVQKGTSYQFSASVFGTNNPDQGVTWSVESSIGNASTIAQDGTLTVGANEASGSLTVRATSKEDGGESGTATVTVSDAPPPTPTVTTVTVTPNTITLDKGDSHTFSAAVAGDNSPGQGVTWSVSPATGGSSIGVDGKLTVGANETAGSLTVTATSTVDPTKSGTATVTVPQPTCKITFNANGGSVSPATMQTGADGKLASLPTPTRSGSYRFDGWFTAASGGTSVTTATVFTSDTTIYAHWTYTGGGDYSGGGSTPSTPSTPANAPVDVTKSQATDAAKEAAKTAKASDSPTATVCIKNPGKITLDALKAMATAAGMPVRFQADSMSEEGKAVDVRITLDPAKAGKELNLSASTTSTEAKATKNLFERFFTNDVRSIHLDQTEAWGQPVEIAAKVDLTGMDITKLMIYSYDKATNTYRRIEKPAYWIDKNGYLHFTTSLAGDIVISEGPLTLKKDGGAE